MGGWRFVALALSAVAPSVMAGEADVVDVRVLSGGGAYTFHVTVKHADSGWDHYADKWDVVLPDGTVIATRILHHPHVDEQPFTRSLSDVRIPPGVDRVAIRAHDKVHGYGGTVREVKLPR